MEPNGWEHEDYPRRRPIRRGLSRDFDRYARALDLYLQGYSIVSIGVIFGVTKQRAHQIVGFAAHLLAFRVFRGVPRYRWRFNRQRGLWMLMR